MKVSTLLEGLKYICCQGSTEQEVSTVVYDSRKVEENSLFICIRGAVVDGHKFVLDVIRKGAKTLVVEEEVEGDFLEEDESFDDLDSVIDELFTDDEEESNEE